MDYTERGRRAASVVRGYGDARLWMWRDTDKYPTELTAKQRDREIAEWGRGLGAYSSKSCVPKYLCGIANRNTDRVNDWTLYASSYLADYLDRVFDGSRGPVNRAQVHCFDDPTDNRIDIDVAVNHSDALIVIANFLGRANLIRESHECFNLHRKWNDLAIDALRTAMKDKWSAKGEVK